MFFATLGVIASSIENIATEIRHMQRTEVLEAADARARRKPPDPLALEKGVAISDEDVRPLALPANWRPVAKFAMRSTRA